MSQTFIPNYLTSNFNDVALALKHSWYLCDTLRKSITRKTPQCPVCNSNYASTTGKENDSVQQLLSNRLSDTAGFLRILHWRGWDMPCRAHWAKGHKAIQGRWWGKDYSKKIRVDEQRDKEKIGSISQWAVTIGTMPYFKTSWLKSTRQRKL